MFAPTHDLTMIREDLAQVGHKIEEYLRVDMEIGTVADIFTAVLAGKGKMIRPILLLLCASMGRPQDNKHLHKLAALVEMVHMASLIHDDIVDESPLRRNVPTIQKRFGKDMAVYSGDFLLSRVMQQLLREEFCAYGVILAHAIEEMCRGELGQYACRHDTETTLESYYKNIQGKTVALFTACCKIGAMAGGCNEQQTLGLARFGEQLGYLFQLRDDMLDFLSCQQQCGKPVHQDFLEGIYTMPVLFAMGNQIYGPVLKQIAEETSKGILKRLDDVSGLVSAAGGITFTCQQISAHTAQAGRILKNLPDHNSRQALQSLLMRLSDMSDIAGQSAS